MNMGKTLFAKSHGVSIVASSPLYSGHHVPPSPHRISRAFYHVTARGDRREDIFEGNPDRQEFLSILEQVISQFNWVCYAWCLMDNHYHLLIQTPDGNLSKGMRQSNGVYTQASNRRHGRVGHLFQGRFKPFWLTAMPTLARYIVLNPVRAGMTKKPADWKWSSYRSSEGIEPAPHWLAADGLLAMFGKRRSLAQGRYGNLWWTASRRIPLGST